NHSESVGSGSNPFQNARRRPSGAVEQDEEWQRLVRGGPGHEEVGVSLAIEAEPLNTAGAGTRRLAGTGGQPADRGSLLVGRGNRARQDGDEQESVRERQSFQFRLNGGGALRAELRGGGGRRAAPCRRPGRSRRLP